MVFRGRLRRFVLLLTALALVATACSGGSADESEAGGGGSEGAAGSEGGATGGEVSYYLSEPEHLAPPSNVTESEGNAVMEALYSPLVELDLETSEAIYGDDAPNAVAESVESDDQQTWTITLKEGWTFHDGTPVTAQSYVDTWNEGASNPEYTGNYFFSFIEGYDEASGAGGGSSEAAGGSEAAGSGMSGLEVIDDQTFEVTLGEPFSQWPLVISYTAFYPLPEACLSDMASCEEAPIGNGPFQMDGQWEHDQNISLVRYDDFGGGQPAKIDALNFPIYADINTGYTDLQAGNIDIMDTVPPEQYDAAQQEFGDRFIEADSSQFDFLGYPTYDEAFSDPQLRAAISMAIDRQAIIDAILREKEAADAFVSPVVAGYREGACGENCTYDPDAAKQMFDEAGGYDGTMTLWFNSGAGHEEWMEAVSNQLRQNLGISDINFESLDFAQYLPKLEAEEITGPYRLAWVMDYPSPQNYLENLLYTGASSNYTGWSNEEFDQFIDEGNAAESIDAGLESYAQAEDIAVEEMPLIPMFFGKVVAAHSDRVTNVEFNAQENLDYTQLEVTE
jgi:oligopeptide transport system substrate-binding protein